MSPLWRTTTVPAEFPLLTLRIRAFGKEAETAPKDGVEEDADPPAAGVEIVPPDDVEGRAVVDGEA